MLSAKDVMAIHDLVFAVEIMVDVVEGLLDAQGLADVFFALHTASN